MVPECWKVVEIGQCLSLLKSGLSRQLSNDDIGIPVIRSGNMSDQEVDFSDLKFWYIDDPQGANTQNYILDDGDLLINFINSQSQIGKSCLFKNKIGRPCIYTTNILRAKAKNKIDGQYLFYTTKTKQYNDYIQSITKPAVNQASFTTADFKKYKFPLPPHNEQRIIAQILFTWDKAIATTEQLLANSQQQKKALMQQLLTGRKRLLNDNGVKFSGEFKRVELGSVFEKISNGVAYDASNSDGLPVTRIETISTGKVNFEKVGWAPDDENTKRFKLERGDVLYSHINSLEHIGRVAYFNDNRPLYHGMNLLLLRAKKEYDSLFFYHLLNSQVGKKYAKSYAKSAVNQASISTTDIKTFKVYIPDSEEQQKIAAVLSAADQEITALQQKLDSLKQEKKALMQQLLTGKRRVKVEAAA